MTTRLDIRDEEILLLGLCRLTFNPEIKIMLQALAEGPADWEYFVFLANVHGVEALVYTNLDILGFTQYIKPEVVSNLRNRRMMSLGRNVRIFSSVTDILRILRTEKMKIILLKGLALEMIAYGNNGLRQMTDADLLLSKEDCLRAYKILKSNGFRSAPLKSAIYKLIVTHLGKHLPSLYKNDISLDLHIDLFGNNGSKLTCLLFENSKQVLVNGEAAYIPDVQLLFLYLVKHLYLHEMNNESQLRLYADLVILIEKYRDEIINSNLIDLAIRADMCEILAWRLEPLRDLWGISFPSWLNDFINKWYNPDSINRFISFLKSPKGNTSPDRAEIFRQRLSEVNGIHRKFLFVFGDLFPTMAFMKKRYNCKNKITALLYYPHRFGKLIYLLKK